MSQCYNLLKNLRKLFQSQAYCTIEVFDNLLKSYTFNCVVFCVLFFLVDNRREAWIGSDPHFAIRLPGGSLLCYSFQGLVNSTFNLVHNDQLQMNALFVPDDTNYDNTWLGSIGITVHHDGKKVTTLKFIGAGQLVKIADRVRLDARTIEKLTFRSGELSLLKIPLERSPRYPRIHVSFEDSGVDFVVSFTKNNHLDLYWHNTGAPSKHSSGVVGNSISLSLSPPPPLSLSFSLSLSPSEK